MTYIHVNVPPFSTTNKRQRTEAKCLNVATEKNKMISEPPTAIRRSLRTQGKVPDSASGVKDKTKKKSKTSESDVSFKKSPRRLGPISMREVYSSAHGYDELVKKIMGICNEYQLSGCSLGEGSDGGCCENNGFQHKGRASFDVELRELELKNVARVVPGWIMNLKFFPSLDTMMVVAGSKFGNVGFWNLDSENVNGDGDGIYMYYPHSGPVSGISIQPFSLSKMITSSYDGYIRVLDVEKETFSLAYSSEYAIFSISQRSEDVNSLYFAEGQDGVLGIWDERCGNPSSSWILHEDRINTIDFNSVNTNMMATSSKDGTACIWDLRKLDNSTPKPLKTVKHKKAVHSAYFSPSGSLLTTTSTDDKIGVVKGVDEVSMIDHNNQTSRFIPPFRAVWGWDDSYIFVGNTNKGIDVVSADDRRIIATLESPLMSAIPCRFDTHPLKVGMLAGATAGGEVYVWKWQ